MCGVCDVRCGYLTSSSSSSSTLLRLLTYRYPWPNASDPFLGTITRQLFPPGLKPGARGARDNAFKMRYEPLFGLFGG